MSRHTLHSEENFWPCVSDMFLALFVIALVLYAQASKKMSDGDLRITDQVIAETLELMDGIRIFVPENEAEYNQTAQNIRNEIEAFKAAPSEQQHFPELVKALDSISKDSHIVGCFKQNPEPITPDDDPSNAVNKIYKACQPTEQLSHSGEQMRHIRRHIIATLITQPEPNNNTEDTIHNLSEALGKVSKLQATIKEKEAIIRRLESEIQMLKQASDSEHLNEQITVLSGELEALKNELQKDTRGMIMRRVSSLLDKYGLRGKVEIMESQGIIRIPTSSVSFGNMDNTFTTKSITKGHDILKKLADLLVELTNDSNYGSLIESIVIEGHASPDARNKMTKNTTNEIASSYRALLVWFYMNGTFDNKQKLQNITNSSGISLFSHAGFGDRIPLERIPNEDNDSFNLRCRRIDIRFISTPIQVKN